MANANASITMRMPIAMMKMSCCRAVTSHSFRLQLASYSAVRPVIMGNVIKFGSTK